MGERVVSIDKGTVEKLMELREPGSDSLCKHDWVGDDECAYCRIDELERQLAEKDEYHEAYKEEYLDTLKELCELCTEKDAEIEHLNRQLSCTYTHPFPGEGYTCGKCGFSRDDRYRLPTGVLK